VSAKSGWEIIFRLDSWVIAINKTAFSNEGMTAENKTFLNNAGVIFMCTRRHSRECALQMLYLSDQCYIPVTEVLKMFAGSLPKSSIYREFSLNIFKGVCEQKKILDDAIIKNAENWKLDRMSAVDRNIMRMSAYEILFCPETPIKVIINEAVEISKKFSTQDSGKFVNGILDKLKLLRI
jgi:N utilization substance protein B